MPYATRASEPPPPCCCLNPTGHVLAGSPSRPAVGAAFERPWRAASARSGDWRREGSIERARGSAGRQSPNLSALVPIFKDSLTAVADSQIRTIRSHGRRDGQRPDGDPQSCSARAAVFGEPGRRSRRGSPDLIRNVRRGRMPSLERLKALCEVLELDFYVGPRRRAGAVDVGRLREAIASTERTLGAHGLVLELEARADAIAAVYDLLDRERAPATAQRVQELIEALGRVPPIDGSCDQR